MQPGEKIPGSAMILVGGPSKHVKWNSENVLKHVQRILDVNPSVHINIITSRRTPQKLVKDLSVLTELSNSKMTTPDQVDLAWLPNTLAVTFRVWVTSDSVSMVYEALTANCSVSLIDIPFNDKSRIKIGIDHLVNQALLDMSPAYIRESYGLVALSEANNGAKTILARLV